jgi:hypothetical protein
MEGMTLQKTDHRQTESLPCAVSRNGIQRVLRTGRLKSADTPEHRGNHETVPVDEPHTEMPHLNLTWDAEDDRGAAKSPTPVSVLREVEPSLLAWEIRVEPGREPNLGAPALPIREIPAWRDFAEPHHQTVCPPLSRRSWARHPSYRPTD